MIRSSRGEAFEIAYRGGCVMGFTLVSLSLLVLVALIVVYKSKINTIYIILLFLFAAKTIHEI